MPLYRCQVGVALESVLARDRCVNTIYFADDGVTSDPANLIHDLVEVFKTLWYSAGNEIEGKIYDVGSPPNFPLATYKVNSGVANQSGAPREVALCLSFYGERNLPRTRGRIFLGLAHASRSISGGRPGPTMRNEALALATGIAGVGGTDVDWSIYSPTAGADEAVKTAYVDDEWDTVRSRGLRPTTRTILQINE